MSVEVFGKPVNKRHKICKVHTQEQEIPQKYQPANAEECRIRSIVIKIRWLTEREFLWSNFQLAIGTHQDVLSVIEIVET